MTLLAAPPAATRELSPAEGARLFALIANGVAAERALAPGLEFARRVAGHAVRLGVAGRRWTDTITAAFGHLPPLEPGSAAGLSIELADGSQAAFEASARELALLLPEEDATVSSVDGRWVGYRRAGTVSCLDRADNRIVVWSRAEQPLSLTDQGRPLDAPLFLWLRDRGVATVHAGLVARNGNGMLVAGKSGSGKTSTVLHCLLGGFDLVSDDYVGLEARPDGQFLGHGLHGSTRLLADDLERFPTLAPYAIAGALPGEDKVLVRLSEVYPARLRPAARITLLVLPRVTGVATPALRPAAKSQALLRLAPSSLWMVHHPHAGAFDRLAALVQQVPCYWLDLGGARAAIAPGLEALLEEVLLRSQGARTC